MSDTTMLGRLKTKARELKRHIFVLYLACRDPRVPWYAKLFALCIVAYAFSPIDLIPDFIPVLGYVDDLILVPLGIALAFKMIPAQVIDDCRSRADQIRQNGKPTHWAAGVLIIALWVLLAVWLGNVCYKYFG